MLPLSVPPVEVGFVIAIRRWKEKLKSQEYLRIKGFLPTIT